MNASKYKLLFCGFSLSSSVSVQKDQEFRDDKAIFDAYVSLRRIAHDYRLENELAIPRVVFVGETSSGKSMLVQNFLRFPCAFSQGDVGTRCPVLYRLRYNPNLEDGKIVIRHPSNISKPEDLAEHLRLVMECIEHDEGFRIDEYLVHIESNQYRDFEILDVPGLIGGCEDGQREEAVERITERYVRDPTFLIVQLKEASQLLMNSFGTKRIRELCLAKQALRGSTFPARVDYENYAITIQTKFDVFMDGHRHGSDANEGMKKLVDHFNEQTLFVSMIFSGYNFSKHSNLDNTKYIAELSRMETEHVDDWIETMKLSSSSRTNERFDEERYRQLIGVDRVRGRIQDMWVKAFRGAIPKIHETLQQLVEQTKNEYEIQVTVVEQNDLNTIRETYQKYIQKFRSILSSYINFRVEILNLFKFHTFARTYAQIEDEYNHWPRKYPLTWSAHQTTTQMIRGSKGDTLSSLQMPVMGAAHFDRIRQVFFYMILTYQPSSISDGWLTSAKGLLYGAIADNDNAEKAARELLYSYIGETFTIGICWLTQMYSFLLEHFEQHVTQVLLSNTGGFASLSRGHETFLGLLRLEYHQITRQMIRNAVQASKHARHAKMVYASYSICQYLRTLVESIGPGVHSQHSKETSLVDTDPARLMSKTDVFIPEKRPSEMKNNHPATRNTVNELYIATRGLLLHEITTQFYVNIVSQIQDYKSISITNSLESRIDRMSDEEIARLSHIDFNELTRELQHAYEKLVALEDAEEDIVHASRLFDAKSTYSLDQKTKERDPLDQRRAQRHEEIMSKLYQVNSKRKGEEVTMPAGDHVPVQSTDEDQLKQQFDENPSTSSIYLLDYIRKDDREDLEHSFLQGENFQINQNQSKSIASKTMTNEHKGQKTTADDVNEDNQEIKSNAASIQLKELPSNTVSKSQQDKPKKKFFGHN